ncbi:MAG: DUF721 domain-containing protein [Desulfobulbaceae bacterium]|nr:DUF721 domain-containing protein [Desulfobulbaceae bacterium]
MKERTNNRPQLLGGQLHHIYGEKNWQGQWELFSLVKNWCEIAGNSIADQTTPAYFRHDVLWVFVRSSAWMQHVQILKPELISKVNQYLRRMEISDIRWLLQPAELCDQQETAGEVRENELDPSREQTFRQMASTVDNAHCRNALNALWKTFQKKGRQR